MQDTDGGLHPAVGGQSLGERRKRCMHFSYDNALSDVALFTVRRICVYEPRTYFEAGVSLCCPSLP